MGPRRKSYKLRLASSDFYENPNYQGVKSEFVKNGREVGTFDNPAYYDADEGEEHVYQDPVDPSGINLADNSGKNYGYYEGVQPNNDDDPHLYQELNIRRPVPVYRKSEEKSNSGCSSKCIKVSVAVMVIVVLAVIAVVVYFLGFHDTGTESTTTPAPPKPAPQFEVDFRIDDMSYSPALSNPAKQEYKSLAKEVEKNLDTIYKNSNIGPSYDYSKVTQFSQGSVKVKYDVFMKSPPPGTKPTVITKDTISQVLVKEVKEKGSFGRFSVDPNTIKVKDIVKTSTAPMPSTSEMVTSSSTLPKMMSTTPGKTSDMSSTTPVSGMSTKPGKTPYVSSTTPGSKMSTTPGKTPYMSSTTPGSKMSTTPGKTPYMSSTTPGSKMIKDVYNTW
ncbi:uncharacterized protein LOC141899157 [Tubulanus polymorphus]|uniref:uncharacterized protein LOC141899157 n=1 Tax=Tubulanus polymorphus TaxID=672921 RepID=UPI003DA39231